MKNSKMLWGVVFAALIVSLVVKAQTVVDQGQPGTQGPWPVTGASSSASDAGFLGYTLTQPCTRIVSINDAGYGTTPSRVPASGPTSGRIWIRICNSLLNGSSTQCICATDSCPSSVSVLVQGDVLATGDCATYPLGVADSGVPCCVCNGADSRLPSQECIP